LYNNENINPTLIWELIKSDIRGYAIKYSSEVKKQETEVIKDKERVLNTLEALQESLNYTDQNIENNIKVGFIFSLLYKVSFSCINFCRFSMNLSSRRDVLNLLSIMKRYC
jgi:hypothetical protein